MLPVQIKPNIYWIGVNDRTKDLFEGLWPVLQDGISYNTYLIDDEKKVLIDMTAETMTESLLEKINEITPISSIDYVVINHMEPDHSGALSALKRVAPDATLLVTKPAQKMLDAFYGVTEGIQVVGEGFTLPLGEHTLRFVSTPNVHWPETMMTYEEKEQILFSCDAFGGYGALNGTIFDDECVDISFYRQEALRYFSTILPTYSKQVLYALSKFDETPVSVVAPSHGLVWRGKPEEILGLYKTWAQYANGPAEKAVTLLYGSMYKNTEKVMDVVAQGVVAEGVPVKVIDVARNHHSYILPHIWQNQGVLVGAPTYDGSMYPEMKLVLEMASQKHVYNRTAAYFGSFGWGGGAVKYMTAMAETLKWSLQEPLLFNGSPFAEDFKKAAEFGGSFARLIKKG